MITAAGVGSGIDVENIISQLMEIERAPVRALDAKKERLDVELSAFGTVKSAMSELEGTARTIGDRTTFGPFVASSTDEAVFTATASGAAAAESHDVEVLALASAHRVGSAGYDSDAAEVRTGTWSFSVGDTDFDVEIDSGARTLRDLRDAINDSPDNDGLVASLLNVDGGTRLTLTAREPGAANSISVTRPGVAGGGALGGGGAGSDDGGFTEITPASDASLIVDGFAVTRASNSIGDVIEGVTLELAGVGTAKLDTQRDTESLRESLDTFVTQYNALRSELSSLSEGNLQGDRLPRDAELRLRSAFSLPVAYGDDQSVVPTELGFTFDRYGVLSVDEARLVENQTANLERFVDAFTRAETGFAAQLRSSLEEFTRADGLIDNREDGIDRRRSVIDRQIDRYDYRLEQTEARYRRQFTAMDQMVTQLQSTSAFLADRLSSL